MLSCCRTLTSDLLIRTQTEIAQLTNPEISVDNLDLTNCDREPIHIPSAIQPHAALIVVNQSNKAIVQVSENVSEFFARSPQTLLNQPLASLVSETQVRAIKDYLNDDSGAAAPLRLELETNSGPQLFSATVHQGDRYFLLELERATADRPTEFFDFYRMVKCPVVRLQQTRTIQALQQQAVEEIQTLFDFDRVMAYWFHEDGSGSVVAEAKREGLSAFKGLRYPATDIPKQARALYVLNRLRAIPDITYQPVYLTPAHNPINDQPLDMSLVGARSVSPVHIEYLTTMGVRASLSISLVQDDQLVGLIACHHHSPKRLSFEQRAVCEFLGGIISSELAGKKDSEDAEYKIGLKSIQTRFVQALTDSTDLRSGLTQNSRALMALTSADGVAYCDGGEITLFGKTPPTEAVKELTVWLADKLTQTVVYQTCALGENYPPAEKFGDRTSGLLALALSRRQQAYVLWFRQEEIQTVDWAGNPDKQVNINPDGTVHLSPRKSFDLWKERVEGRSLPWKPCEIEAALDLRTAVIGLVLQKSDELAQLNTELMRSNVELDSFAYVASHDLKEPLRGIHNYSSFLIEDYGEILGEDGQEKLNTLMRLTQRMEALINSLLHYSRLGRAELRDEPVDMNRVVESAVEVVKISQPGEITFEIAKDLPMVMGDRTRLSELFTNLITNGIKYNKSDSKTIEIGYISSANTSGISTENSLATLPIQLNSEQTLFYVRDNGIGIREKHLDNVFKIFKRLHPAGRYGGGTGAGLTIVKKIVERHGGQIWIDSTFGQGSTFYFSLKNS